MKAASGLGGRLGLLSIGGALTLWGCADAREPATEQASFASVGDSLTLCAPTTYEAENMTPSTGGGIQGGWNLWSNGTLSTQHAFVDSPVTLTVYAAGTLAAGQWPNMLVWVDDSAVGSATVATTSFVPYSFTLDASAGTRAIRIEFTNDYYQNGEDRNLLLDKLEVSCNDVVDECADGVWNGAETDMDCGGPECAPCAPGNACEVNGDCASSLCQDGACLAEANCFDGQQNGDETDVDCGGSCEGCLALMTCEVSQDCAHGAQCIEVEPAAVCWYAPTCDDGVWNGSESDIDCGGALCTNCSPTQSCRDDGDCDSNRCVDDVCQFSASCFDGQQNGDETDVDCGGNCDVGCQAYQVCVTDGDCGAGFACFDIPGYDSLCYFIPDCDDGVWNGVESDVDCGGNRCAARCRPGQECLTASDCENGTCVDGTCASDPACVDGVQNGSETDVDCGGTLCGPCATGQFCAADADCEQSSHCDPDVGVCEKPETCEDGLTNRDETDVDCGGTQCDAPCLPGEGCVLGADCTTGSCVNNTCQPYGNCFDYQQNGDEGGVDCGGSCAPCGDGNACAVDDDCLDSRTCTAGVCVPNPTCRDNTTNRDETDVDCGGTYCQQCVAGKGCADDDDCFKGTCVDAVCTAYTATPECDDGTKNGTESDVDCGGLCNKCEDGQACQNANDCMSGTCVDNSCASAPACDDEAQNGAETDVDCGGPLCNGCAAGQGCLTGSDCLNGACVDGQCQAVPSCNDGAKNGSETDVDCGGDCSACADGQACSTSGDCASGACSGGVCQSAATCDDGLQNGNETDVDCGGSCEDCPTGGSCASNGDCVSGNCQGGVCAPAPSQSLGFNLQVSSEWQSGYCVNITVTNTTSQSIASWVMALRLNQSAIYTSWSANYSGSNPATVTPASWNGAQPPGGTAYFGYCANKTGGNWRPQVLSVVSQ